MQFKDENVVSLVECEINYLDTYILFCIPEYFSKENPCNYIESALFINPVSQNKI